MDGRRWRLAQRGQIDLPLRLASRAFDFKPGIAAVDGLIDGGAHMRSFQLSASSLSAVRISPSPLARASADWAATIVVMTQARPSSD
ncbi:hypothetical protein ABIA96_001700 [Bradyrhizobium sp. LB11.1]